MIYVFICSMIDLGQMKQTHWVCFQKQRPTSALLTVFLFGILEFPAWNSSQVEMTLGILDWLHPKKLTCPPKRNHFNKKVIFQPLCFRGHVSFRGSNSIYLPCPWAHDLHSVQDLQLLSFLSRAKRFQQSTPALGASHPKKHHGLFLILFGDSLKQKAENGKPKKTWFSCLVNIWLISCLIPNTWSYWSNISFISSINSMCLYPPGN